MSVLIDPAEDRRFPDWLNNLHLHCEAVAEALQGVYGTRHVQRRRMFFMACEELFGYRGGREWLLCHLFGRRESS